MNAKQQLAIFLLDHGDDFGRDELDEIAFSISVHRLSREARAIADQMGLFTVTRIQTWASGNSMPVVHATDKADALAKQMKAAAVAAAANLLP